MNQEKQNKIIKTLKTQRKSIPPELLVNIFKASINLFFQRLQTCPTICSLCLNKKGIKNKTATKTKSQFKKYWYICAKNVLTSSNIVYLNVGEIFNKIKLMSEQQDRLETNERKEQSITILKLTNEVVDKLTKVEANKMIKQLQSVKKRISRRSEAKEGSSVHVDKEVCIQCKKEIPTLNMDRHKKFHNIAQKRKDEVKKKRLENKILVIKQKKGLKEITAGPSTSKKSDVMPKRKRGRKETDGSVKRGMKLTVKKKGNKGGKVEEPGPSSALD